LDATVRLLSCSRNSPAFGEEESLSVEDDTLTTRGVILDTVALVTENFSASNIKRIMLQAFNDNVSTTSEQAPNLINIAAQKTLQIIDTTEVEEQDFFNLLSRWLLEELGLSPSVLEQNPKLGCLAETKSQAQR
jgi:hypothetical protein